MENNLAFGQKCSSHNVLVLMIGLRFESLRTECKSEYSDGDVCVCVCRWLAATSDVPASCSESSAVLQNAAEQRLP